MGETLPRDSYGRAAFIFQYKHMNSSQYQSFIMFYTMDFSKPR